MDTLNYLLLVNIYLILFYVFYGMFLKDETFFKLNRIYLVGGASLSFLIPFLQSEWIRSLFITKQVEAVTQNISLTFSYQAIIIPAEEQAFETGEIILSIYLAGAMLGLLRFFWQLYKVQSILKSEETDHAFSFFNKVKVGNSVPNRGTVYDHELVHARQWHSADVILFEIISIVNWFNPVVYLYRKGIKHIHEFTADEIASRQEESKSAYAVILLSKTFGIPTHQLTNSFYNQSLLKRRIIMLHKSKSTRNALLKYGLSAPLFAAMMVLSSATFKSEKVAEKISNVSSEALGLVQSNDTTETDYEKFLKRNSTVKAVEWNSMSKVTVVLKSGKKESYDLAEKADLKKAEGLYGSFPMPPPPPPPMQVANTPQVSLEKQDGPLFTEVEVSPEFPGGMKAFYEYLGKNIKYPAEAKKKNIAGKVILQFVVEKDGKLSEIKVLRGLGHGLDEESIRVLNASPNWKPGIQNGKAVRVQYTLPISFSTPGVKTGAVSDITPSDRINSTGIPKNAIFIVDGKEMSQAQIKEIDTKLIRSMNVLKGENATTKYGDKGKDGIVEMYVNTTPSNLSSPIVETGKNTDSNARPIRMGNYPPAKFEGLVIIDGKEAINNDGKAFSRINPDDIESINVLKDAAATKEHGERGKNGVVQITLKKK